MTTILLIAVIAIIVAAIIAKVYRNENLFWRLLFCFSVSICIAGSLNSIISNKNVESNASISKVEKSIETHTETSFAMARELGDSKETVGEETINFINLTVQYLTFVPTIATALVVQNILDSS